LNAGDVDTSRRTIDLSSVDTVDEKCREDLHGQDGNRSHLPVEQSAASLNRWPQAKVSHQHVR
jgi:hypothetical protein